MRVANSECFKAREYTTADEVMEAARRMQRRRDEERRAAQAERDRKECKAKQAEAAATAEATRAVPVPEEPPAPPPPMWAAKEGPMVDAAKVTSVILRIQRSVARAIPCRLEYMTTHSRTPVAVRARQFAMALCKKLSAASYPEIGRRFGGRDHTTAIHAVRATQERIRTMPEFAAEADRIEDAVRADLNLPPRPGRVSVGNQEKGNAA